MESVGRRQAIHYPQSGTMTPVSRARQHEIRSKIKPEWGWGYLFKSKNRTKRYLSVLYLSVLYFNPGVKILYSLYLYLCFKRTDTLSNNRFLGKD